MTDQEHYKKITDEAAEWFVLMRSDEISVERHDAFLSWMAQSEKHLDAYLEAGDEWDALPFDMEENHTVGAVGHEECDLLGEAKVIPFSTKEKLPKNSLFNLSIFKSVAASLVAVVMIGYMTSSYWLQDHYQTAVGERTDIMLSDGSHLVLNTATELSVDMKRDKRIIYLSKGEVFFEVARDENRPFYVETAGGLVQVLGTKFNVKAKEGYSDVTVIEGRVSVTDHGTFDQNTSVSLPEYILIENQKFILGNEEIKNEILTVDAVQSISWRKGKLIYNGAPFEELVADLNRYYEAKIHISEPELKKMEIVAIVQIEDQKKTLEALAKTFGITVEHVSGNRINLYLKK